jgi:hypothetical protein
MAIYESPPERLYRNAADPLLGELEDLEMKTAMAYGEGGRPREKRRRFGSSRDVARFLATQKFEPGLLVVIAMDAKNVPMNAFPAPYSEASRERDVILAAAKVAILTGGIGAIVVHTLPHAPTIDDLDEDEARRKLVEILEEFGPSGPGMQFRDYLVVGPMGSYRSALDEDLFGR